METAIFIALNLKFMENLHRYKITEIPERRYRTRQYRDNLGQLQTGTEEYTTYREVKVITGWARFGHYIIDAVILWVVQSLINAAFGFAVGFEASRRVTDIDDLFALQMKLSLIGLSVSFIYYCVFEIMFSSTPGKMMLGRIVIDEYALKPEPGSIVIRSLSRLVPFEAFSCLADRGWHDRWSKTFVVDKQEAETLWNLLNQVERDRAQYDADNYRRQQGPGNTM